MVSFTDGVEPLQEPFDLFSDWGAFASYVHRNGIDRTIRLLRTFEGTDEDCREYPRLKPSDDVGIITVEPE
ncbi:hypothetical protein [Halocatena halophila]|uniref:hypothetical protein n=1 Tax=Halocatena halophila TaxID=2814576 RepID=UPI002ED1846C